MLKGFVLLFAAAFTLANVANAQWHPDTSVNTPVCTLSGSQHSAPQICTDDSDGAVIVWQDTRNGVTNLFAQRVNARGYAMWAHNGVRLSTPKSGNYGQQNPIVASDGSGGAYVVWQDTRNGGNGIDLYGQHILANGVLAGPDTGFAVCTFKTDQINPAICSDGVGGAFVAWEDYRPYVPPKFGYLPEIYMNHLSGGGATLGKTGVMADTGIGIQRNPVLCNDGTGGCYLAWEDGSTVPYSIQANHFNANGNPYWGIKGNEIYGASCQDCYSADATHISMQRDGQQLMLAWQSTSVDGNGQNVMATRIRCSTSSDTTQVWGNPIDVTGDMPFDQTLPQIFSDDSATVSGIDFRGIIVPFEFLQPGSLEDWDVSMIRVLGDGTTQLPGGGYAYQCVHKPHGQVDFQAVKITDKSGTGAGTGFLAIWADAWDGTDTMIYAQRMDRSGKPYFGKSPNWGMCISGNSPTKQWTAHQPCIVARSDGAIAAWTDMRNGSASIYCQLIRMDGLLWVPHDTVPPVVTFTSTGSYNGSQCNARCYNVLAADTGALKDGIDTVIPKTMSNMQLTATSFNVDRSSASFSICVIDSMKSGYCTIRIVDSQSNVLDTNFTYCTIADSKPPVITSTLSQSPYWVDVHLHDDGPWDRGLKSYVLTSIYNVKFDSLFGVIKSGDTEYTLTANIIDSSRPAHFSIHAIDIAGNVSVTDTFSYSGNSGVAESPRNQVSISVFPNPTSGGTIISLDGAPDADVTITDVLGRTIEQFRLEASHEWQPKTLARGAYTIRAVVGDAVIYKRIVRE